MLAACPTAHLVNEGPAVGVVLLQSHSPEVAVHALHHVARLHLEQGVAVGAVQQGCVALPALVGHAGQVGVPLLAVLAHHLCAGPGCELPGESMSGDRGSGLGSACTGLQLRALAERVQDTGHPTASFCCVCMLASPGHAVPGAGAHARDSQWWVSWAAGGAHQAVVVGVGGEEVLRVVVGVHDDLAQGVVDSRVGAALADQVLQEGVQQLQAVALLHLLPHKLDEPACLGRSAWSMLGCNTHPGIPVRMQGTVCMQESCTGATVKELVGLLGR